MSATHLAILRTDPAPRRVEPPAQLTSFVGRAAELERLGELRSARLVTILGPGGAGKTRLAIEATRGREACFVDLSQVEFVASMGVRMFISTARSLSRKNARLVLFGPQDGVREVFDGVSLGDIVPIRADETEALAALDA